MIKGLEALTAECLFAARQYGVEEAVLASLHASFPSLGWNDAFPDYLISRVAEHGIRRSEEMEEVVKTLRDVAGEGVMSQATAKASATCQIVWRRKALPMRSSSRSTGKRWQRCLKARFKRIKQHVVVRLPVRPSLPVCTRQNKPGHLRRVVL